MSDTSTTAPAEGKPKKSKLMVMIIAAVVVLAVGGGGAFFFLKRGQAAETAGKDKKGSKEGKSKNKGEEEEEPAEPAEGEKGQEAGVGKPKFSIKSLDLPDDKDVKQVIELQPFVVNLADKGESHYLRVSVSIGIGETKEEKPDALLTTRVRNALLAVLISKTSEEVLTEQGKVVLRKQLLKAARAAIEEPAIEAVYITDFIVQL